MTSCAPSIHAASRWECICAVLRDLKAARKMPSQTYKS